MELSFAAASWLAGLSALLVPVLLHWLASQQQTPSRFAPMRFLQNLAAEQRGRRLSELLLLLVRLLLIALVVLALAGPRLQTAVTRSMEVTVLHPLQPKAAADSTTYRLCAGAELRPANEMCAATPTPAADRFLADLLQAIAAHPEWASVTVQAPAQLSVAPLSLPMLPIPLRWQIDPASTATSEQDEVPWQVLASDEDWRWFAAGNAVRATPRWQRTEQVESADVVVSGSQTVTGGDVEAARVWWHDQPAAWQRDHDQAMPSDYFVAGSQLQLRWPGNEPELAAVLLAQSESWLRRGHWQAQINPVTLPLAQQQSLQTTRSADLMPWLMLAALICWLLERRLAHGRR